MKKTLFIGGLALALVLVGAASVVWAAGPSYQAFRAVMGNDRAKQVTEQNFNRFTDMHRMMAEGDYQGAQSVRAELGLGRGNGGGCGMAGGRGGCPMAKNGGSGFVDKNNNGICDNHENLK